MKKHPLPHDLPAPAGHRAKGPSDTAEKMERSTTSIENLLEVYVNSAGEVCIAQRDMAEDCYVAIKAEQVDELVGLLREQQEAAYAFRREPAVN